MDIFTACGYVLCICTLFTYITTYIFHGRIVGFKSNTLISGKTVLITGKKSKSVV